MVSKIHLVSNQNPPSTLFRRCVSFWLLVSSLQGTSPYKLGKGKNHLSKSAKNLGNTCEFFRRIRHQSLLNKLNNYEQLISDMKIHAKAAKIRDRNSSFFFNCVLQNSSCTMHGVETKNRPFQPINKARATHCNTTQFSCLTSSKSTCRFEKKFLVNVS